MRYNGEMKKVITRIAPSPTGAFHIGTARTALFNYLFAKKNNGTFIVRLEDTDKERSEKRYEKDILEALKWLKINPDKYVRQTDRTAIYTKYIKKLIDEGHAYVSKEPSKKDESVMTEVVRFKNTYKDVSFEDELRGNITIDISDLGDFVIARSVTDPLYNLAVVIDDTDMGITHIIRGDDHITNTPRQIVLYKALNADIPIFTHIPLIHSASGGKLSKRKNATSVTEFKDKGYLPEAMINFLSLLGWSPKNDEEFFDMKSLINLFNIEGLQKKEAIFNEKKLEWFQKYYVQKLSDKKIKSIINPSLRKRFPFKAFFNIKAVNSIIKVIKEQGLVFQEEKQAINNGEYDMFFVDPEYKGSLLIPSKAKTKEEHKNILEYLEEVKNILEKMNNDWNEENIKDSVWDFATEKGRTFVLWPLRVALSGKEKSPSPFSIAAAVGKKTTLKRISTSIKQLKDII